MYIFDIFIGAYSEPKLCCLQLFSSLLSGLQIYAKLKLWNYWYWKGADGNPHIKKYRENAILLCFWSDRSHDWIIKLLSLNIISQVTDQD